MHVEMSNPCLMFIFVVFCAVFLALIIFFLCFVYTLLSLSLDYPFFIFLRVSQNLYLKSTI